MIMIDRLRQGGATVIIIEHNLDVIKLADYIIDLGPSGGYLGGNLLFAGTPEDLVNVKESATGEYLKNYLV
jgi:excinuclease ABC subunit A